MSEQGSTVNSAPRDEADSDSRSLQMLLDVDERIHRGGLIYSDELSSPPPPYSLGVFPPQYEAINAPTTAGYAISPRNAQLVQLRPIGQVSQEASYHSSHEPESDSFTKALEALRRAESQYMTSPARYAARVAPARYHANYVPSARRQIAPSSTNPNGPGTFGTFPASSRRSGFERAPRVEAASVHYVLNAPLGLTAEITPGRRRSQQPMSSATTVTVIGLSWAAVIGLLLMVILIVTC